MQTIILLNFRIKSMKPWEQECWIYTTTMLNMITFCTIKHRTLQKTIFNLNEFCDKKPQFCEQRWSIFAKKNVESEKFLVRSLKFWEKQCWNVGSNVFVKEILVTKMLGISLLSLNILSCKTQETLRTWMWNKAGCYITQSKTL